MPVSEIRLDKKDLAKYPFLKETKAFVSRMEIPLDSLIRSQTGVGVRIKENATQRVKDSLGFTDFTLMPEMESIDDEILSYAVARMIVSCLDDRMIMDRLARYEAERAYPGASRVASPRRKTSAASIIRSISSTSASTIRRASTSSMNAARSRNRVSGVFRSWEIAASVCVRSVISRPIRACIALNA